MPPMGHHVYMQKEVEGEVKGEFEREGEIKKVPANEWARYRRSGWVFVGEDEFNIQQREKALAKSKAAEVVKMAEGELPSMANTKTEILAFAEANNLDVDEDTTKAELLEAIEDAQE